jgi:cytochrome c peroxidase
MRRMVMKRILCTFLLSTFFAGIGYAADMLTEKAQRLFSPIPKELKTLKGKPITSELVELGKALYFDPRLSKSDFISCNSCHNVGMGGADYQGTSVGHGWKRGPRNAPTVLNSVFNIAQFWDGRAEDLKEQAKGPVQAAVEMNNTPELIVNTLNSMPGYKRMFVRAFPDEKDPVSFDNMAHAIEVFEATLLTPDSPFDKYLKGDERALTAQERAGLDKFISKGCVACHGGINMGGTGYYKFGVMERPQSELLAGDTGRFKVTSLEKDQYFFKSPSLRNIALTPPYFHSGKVWSLEEATDIMGSVQLGIPLSKADTQDIVAFLRATTGIQPQISYPILPAPTDATPKPVLD